MRFATLESYLLSKDVNVTSVQIIVDLLVPKKQLKVLHLCNLDDDDDQQSSFLLKDGDDKFYNMQTLVNYLSSFWHEESMDEFEISKLHPLPIAPVKKPFVQTRAEIKVIFEKYAYDVKLDDMNKTYVLSNFCRLQVYCVEKAQIGFFVYVDQRKDYETEHKKEKDYLESLMRDPNSKVEDFFPKLENFKNLKANPKFYDWIMGVGDYQRLEVSLKPNITLYDVNLKQFKFEPSSQLSIHLKISIQDVCLLPSK